MAHNNRNIILTIFICSAAQITFAQADTLPYAQQMAATVMTLWKDSLIYDHSRTAIWSYDQGVIYNGLTGLWKYTGNADYFNYIKKHVDDYVNADGTIRTYNKEDYNLDNIRNGDAVLMLYKTTGEPKYWKAANLLYSQLKSQPRTHEGGFWHKKAYPYQMWLDGLYMAEPFYATYAEITHNSADFNDVANQFTYIENHARDKATGLLYHGWDESKQQKWADKTTGTSPNFWGRAMGWYGMALVDALEHFADTSQRKIQLLAILNRYAAAVVKAQDASTGLWWDVLNMPNKPRNFLEASASCMFTYTLAKGIRLGYLPQSYAAAALKGYDGICKMFVDKDDAGLLRLKGTVSVSGLGGNPYRDGSFDYYVREKVVNNDLKGIGAFIQMANEIALLHSRQTGKGTVFLLDGFFNHEMRKDTITGDTVQYHYLWNEEDNNGFSMFKNICVKYGVEARLLTGAVTPAALANTDIYMIVDPDVPRENPHPNYIEPAEIKSIYNWVLQGGILLMFGNDSGNAEFKHFNQLAAKFGITFNENSRNRVVGRNFQLGTLAIPAGDSIFAHTGKIYIKEISTFKVSPPARAVLTDAGDIIISVAKVGKGTVFAVGDPWFYNEYMDGRKLPADLQNYQAAEDLLQWLLKQKPHRKQLN